MIARKFYIKQIEPFIDKPFIKVLTGLRRSGKSSILSLLKDTLVERGIKKESIIHVNLESFQFRHLDTDVAIYTYLQTQIHENERVYILLDEIQEVENWERAVNAMLVDFNADIYITGSNSRLLSSELSTFLTGRYVEFHIQTLCFEEFLEFRKVRGIEDKNQREAFNEFRKYGGFPVLHTMDYDLETAYKIVFDIYSSAILRDTVQRNNIRDTEMLERIVKFVFDNVGNSVSAKNIADYFKGQQRKIDLNTVYNYLKALESSFIIYRIPRYDVKGKEILKTQEKYFVGDIALVHAMTGLKDRNAAGILENIVMLELRRRNYKVYVGKLYTKEIDFIAEKGNEKIYVQVCLKMEEASTIEREFKPLLKIKDNYPKYVVSLDEEWTDNVDGVKHLHIADFLLAEKWG
jgi:predicted AAA+ superfamily ATPase